MNILNVKNEIIKNKTILQIKTRRKKKKLKKAKEKI